MNRVDLPEPFGADDGDDRALGHLDLDGVQRHQAAEPDGDAADRERRSLPSGPTEAGGQGRAVRRKRNGGGLLLEAECRRAPCRRDQTLPAIQHHAHQDDAEDELDGAHQVDMGEPVAADRAAGGVDPAGEVLEPPGLQQLQQHRAGDHAPDAADAAEHHHDEDHHRDREAEHVRRRGLQLGDIEHPGHPGEAGADGEGEQLVAGAVDAHRAGGDLVLADRHPRPSDARVAQPYADQQQQCRERECDVVVRRGVDPEAVAEQARRRDAVQPGGAVGQRGPVADDDRHDLAEAERHDRQVVAAEAKGRQAEQDTAQRRDQSAERQGEPEGEGEVHDAAVVAGHLRHQPERLEELPGLAPGRLQLERIQHAIGIGPDGEERGIAEVEQAGEADDDVEAERQGGKGEGVRQRIDVGFVGVIEREAGAGEGEGAGERLSQPPRPRWLPGVRTWSGQGGRTGPPASAPA